MKTPAHHLKHEETIEKQFERTIVRARDWLAARWRIVALAVVVVAIVVASVVYRTKSADQQREGIWNRLAAASDPQTPLSDLRLLADDAEGTPAGPRALSLLAGKLMDERRFAEAADVYARLADDPTIEVFAEQWRLNQALALENDGRLDEARLIYERLATEHSDSFIGRRAAERLAADLAGFPAWPTTRPATTQPATASGGFSLESPQDGD